MFNHEELKVFFRDGIVPFAEANISISNTGFLYGLGVFTGIRAHFNESQSALYIFRPEAHFKRFYDACRICNYQNFLKKYDYPKFLAILKDLITSNNIKQDAYIRVTNFSDENRITPKFIEYKDSLSAFLYPLGDYVSTSGIRCMVSSWTRIADNSIPARAKINGAYVNTAFAKTEALLNGFDEAIFLDNRGHVVEGSAENFFMVTDSKVITPPVTDDILEGITRQTVMQICKDESIEVMERSIDRSEIYKADEIFLSGTGAKVCPVIEIDHRKIGTGKVGEIAKKVQEVYAAAGRGEIKKYLHWVEKV
jgi:branched-chain amino acid aminotransferase